MSGNNKTHAARLNMIAKHAKIVDPNEYQSRAQEILEYATKLAEKGRTEMIIGSSHQLYNKFPSDPDKCKEFISVLQNDIYGFTVHDLSQSYSDPKYAFVVQWNQ